MISTPWETSGKSQKGILVDMRRNKKTPVIALLTSLALSASILISPVSSAATAQRKNLQQPIQTQHPSLSRYALDLTKLARQGRLGARVSHHLELNRVIKVLGEDSRRNPVLITDSGATGQEIVEGVARKIAAGKVSETMLEKEVFKLNLEALSADV